MKKLLQILTIGALAISTGRASAQGMITTWAGTGEAGYSGDNDIASNAKIGEPKDLAFDAAGNMYILDIANSVIRKVNATTNIITTVAGTGTAGYNGDNIPATTAMLSSPSYLSVDAAGNIYVTDFGNARVRKISTSGIITTIAGNGDVTDHGDNGPATAAGIAGPQGICVDAAGNVYVSTISNSVIRKIAAGTGIITTIAGTGAAGFGGEGGPATAAALNSPSAICLDHSGNLLIADQYNGLLRKVNLSTNIITTFAGTQGMLTYFGENCDPMVAGLGEVDGLCVDDNDDVYDCDFSCSCRKLTKATNTLSIVAGDSVITGFNGDGIAATTAWLNMPFGVRVDHSGNIYIADRGNHRIRRATQPGFTVTGVQNTYNSTANEPVLYPNPTSGAITVSVTEAMQYAQATVINVSGAVVYSAVLKDRHTSIDLSAQPAGIYLLSVKSDKGNYVKQITVTK